MTIVIGLDPGPNETGFVILNSISQKVLEAGVLANGCMVTKIAHMWDDYDDPLLAIEMIEARGMSVGQETFDTARWVGRYEQAWPYLDLPKLVYRRQVKSYLCGSQKAKDTNIRQALIDMFGGDSVAIGKKASPGPLYGVKSHAWPALAVAMTALDQLKALQREAA